MSKIIYADEVRPATQSKVKINQIESNIITNIDNALYPSFIAAENLNRNTPVTINSEGKVLGISNFTKFNNEIYKTYTKSKTFLKSFVMSNGNVFAIYKDSGNAYFDIYNQFGEAIISGTLLAESIVTTSTNSFMDIHSISNTEILITYVNAVTTPSAAQQCAFKKYNFDTNTLGSEILVTDDIDVGHTILDAKGKVLNNGNVCFFFAVYDYVGPGYQTIIYYEITNQSGTSVQAKTTFLDMGQSNTTTNIDFSTLTTDNIFVIYYDYTIGLGITLKYKIITESNSQIKAVTSVETFTGVNDLLKDFATILLNNGNVLLVYPDLSTGSPYYCVGRIYNSAGTEVVGRTIIPPGLTPTAVVSHWYIDMVHYNNNLLIGFNSEDNVSLNIFSEDLELLNGPIEIESTHSKSIRISINSDLISVTYDQDTLKILYKETPKVLGLTNSDVTTGNTVQVILPDQIANGFSNLQLGRLYYSDFTGNISLTRSDIDKPIGVAITSNKMLVKDIG